MSVNSVSINSINDIVSNAKNSQYYDFNSKNLVKVSLIERIFRAIFSFFGWMNSTDVYCRHLSAEAILNSIYGYKHSREEGQPSFITDTFYSKLRSAIYDTSDLNRLPFNRISKDFEKAVRDAFNYNDIAEKELEGEKRAKIGTLDTYSRENAARKQREADAKALKAKEEMRIKSEMEFKNRHVTRNEQLQKATEADCKSWVLESAKEFVDNLEKTHNSNKSAASPVNKEGMFWSALKEEIEKRFNVEVCRKTGDYRTYSDELIKEMLKDRSSVGEVYKLQIKVTGAAAPGGPAAPEEIECRGEEYIFQIWEKLERNRKIKGLEIDGQIASPVALIKDLIKPSSWSFFNSSTPRVISVNI